MFTSRIKRGGVHKRRGKLTGGRTVMKEGEVVATRAGGGGTVRKAIRRIGCRRESRKIKHSYHKELKNVPHLTTPHAWDEGGPSVDKKTSVEAREKRGNYGGNVTGGRVVTHPVSRYYRTGGGGGSCPGRPTPEWLIGLKNRGRKERKTSLLSGKG